jgi:uncharacterized protein (DUF58 family)
MDRVNNIIYYILVVLFIGFAAYFFHSYMLAVAVAAMVIAPVVQLIGVRLSLKRLKISLDGNEVRCRRGKNYKLKITVINKGLMPILNYSFMLNMHNEFSDGEQVRDINVSVPARGKRVIEIKLCPTLCGKINVAVGEVRVRDLFSFFEARLDDSARLAIAVMPIDAEFEDKPRVAENAVDELESPQKDQTGDETVDIRAYMPGDSLKSVHWKLSAKKDELFVREKGETKGDRAVLLFELNKAELNRILDLVYSVVMQYVEAELSLRVCWADRSSEQLHSYTVTGNEELYRLFDRIYTSQLSENDSYALNVAKRQLSGGSVLYVGVGSADKGVTVVDL